MKRFMLALLVIAGCTRRQEPAIPVIPSVGAEANESAERSSLLDLAHGATVVSRSGEAMLEVSALRAVDGDPGSFWMNPPGDLPQSIVVALPARSRIEKVGIRTIDKRGFNANHVEFETSLDGKVFTPLITVRAAESKDPQWFVTKPAEASAVRVTMLDSAAPQQDVRLYSILAAGTELEPPHPGDITGCWTINGRQSRFGRHGARVIGEMQMGNQPIRFDGGFDGRIYRLNWIRGNDYGMALFSVAPDGQHLSGMEWHEEAIPMFFGDSWFGDKENCSTAMSDSGEVIAALLRRIGRFSLYGLRFRQDGSLDAEASADLLRWLGRILASPNVQARLVAHEFRQASPAADHDLAQRELDALRGQLEAAGVKLDAVTFVAQGSEAPRQDPVTESMRALYSSVDLEIRR